MANPDWKKLLTPVRSAGVSEAIVRRLGELLRSGVLQAGQKLPAETDLADYFDVAPMTVRHALAVLRDYGFLDTSRGKKGSIHVSADVAELIVKSEAKHPTVSEFSEFTDWRRTISGEATSLAAQRSSREEAFELIESATQADAPLMSSPEARFTDAHFHIRVAELARCGRLLKAEHKIQAEITRYLDDLKEPPDTQHFNSQSHTPIALAISRGQAEEARKRLEEHVRATLDMLIGLNYLRATPDAAAGVSRPL